MRYVGRLLLVLLLPSTAFAEPTGKPPNVILMMADDLGWSDPGYSGRSDAQTPALDAMAAAGLRLNRFYAAAPVCSPTRGSCLTGRHPHRYGIFYANEGHLPSQEITLAELLRAQGYATGHFGKWHLGTLSKTVVDSNRGGPDHTDQFSPPWLNGFDRSFSTEAKVPTYDPLLRPRNVKRDVWWAPVEDRSQAVPYGTYYWSDGERVQDDLRGDDSKLIMDQALEFIARAKQQEQPFFAVIWFHAPHLPVVADKAHRELYADQDKYGQHYFGCITALDEQVGRLRAALRQGNVADNTLVAFCSDNGPEGIAGKVPGSAAPLRGRKRDLWEGGVRVPGILEWPARIAAGSTSDVPLSTSDYLPTVLELVGAKMPDARPLDGISLVPLIDGKLDERPEPIGFVFRENVALVDNRFKLVGKRAALEKGASEQASPADWMLIDLLDDPSETTDVAHEHPEVFSRMQAQLADWYRSCEASLAGKDYSTTN